jgi:putative serine protease PepD
VRHQLVGTKETKGLSFWGQTSCCLASDLRTRIDPVAVSRLALELEIARCDGCFIEMRGLGRVLAVVALAASALIASCSTAPVSTAPTPSAVPTFSAQASLEDQFIAVVSKVSPSVVAIQTGTGLGSGVIFDAQGDIVTNAHVVAGSSSYRVFLADGQSYVATLVGAFTLDDIAVLRVTAPNLRPAAFGDSDHLRVGSIVMAVGSPLGLQGSVTEGIVSALGRQVSEANGVALPPMIQTSASINPGNSGGALVDLEAQVVGIPTLAAQDPQAGGTAPGIGFAIPSNIAKDIASQLVESGHVTNTHRAYLGVQVASAANGQGASVYAVAVGSPAERGGMKPNDVITSIGGRLVVDQPSLASALSALEPGQTVTVEVQRRDSLLSLTLALGELPG